MMCRINKISGSGFNTKKVIYEMIIPSILTRVEYLIPTSMHFGNFNSDNSFYLCVVRFGTKLYAFLEFIANDMHFSLQVYVQ